MLHIFTNCNILEVTARIQSSTSLKDCLNLEDSYRVPGESAVGGMRYLEASPVIDWVKAASARRIPLILNALPKTLEMADGGEVTALFIEAFAHKAEVASRLISHFIYGGSFAGPHSDHLDRKRDQARSWLSAIQSPAIQNWLTLYIDALSQDIESARISEEREVF